MLLELLESIKNNHLDSNEFEIIINDSGMSHDNTEEIVNGFSDLPIRYFKKTQDDGLDKSVKEMLSLANGRFAWLISDDDIVLKGSIKHLISLIKKYPNSGGMVLNYMAFSADLLYTFKPHSAYNGTPKSDVVQFINNSELFQKVGLHMGYLSCLVLNTQKAKEIIQKIEIPENLWGHTFIAGQISKVNPSWVYSNYAAIGYRSESDSILKSIGLIERQKVTHKNFFDVISAIFGKYSLEEKIIRKQLISKRVPRNILNMKTKNFLLRDQLSVFNLILGYYYKYLVFWILVLPSFLIPKFLLVHIKKFYMEFNSKKFEES